MLKYKNKLFSVLGDSISTFEGCSEPQYAAFYDNYNKLLANIYTTADTWWGIIINNLQGDLLVNNSFSGSTVCWHMDYEIASHACSDERTSALAKASFTPDVIMVYIGTNDWGRGTRIVSDKLNYHDNDPSAFADAYKTMLERLKRKYPNTEIWCLSLAVSRCSAMESFEFPYAYGGRHISEYCDAIKACAEEYNCRFVDLYHNAAPYDTIDGFHANADGMKTIANAVLDELNKQ